MIEKNNVLLKAVLARSISKIQDCLIDGENLFHRDDHGRSYLHLSVFLRSEELVKIFLTEGCNVNEGDYDKVTALHRACRNGCEPIVRLLVKEGANVFAEANNSITPLHVAAAYGNNVCLQILLKSISKDSPKPNGLGVNICDEYLNTPLHYAAAEGHRRIVETLISWECDVNAKNLRHNRPLHYASVISLPELVQTLINAKADVDAVNIKGQTAMHMATLENCSSSIYCLLNAEADPNIKDSNGNTCSHLAIKHGHVEILEILMSDSRTDASISDSEEDTVLHLALKLGHHNLIPIMLPRAKDLTKKDKDGCSVIIEAIKMSMEDLALLMLKTCPSLMHTTTNEFVTPLHLAAERGMTKLTRELLIEGAQVDALDATGLTPSLYCAKNDAVLECLAMIEDIMLINDIDEQNQDHIRLPQVKSNKISSRISS